MPPVTDLRLVPAAAAVWLTAALLVAAPVVLCAAVTVAALLLTLVGGAAALQQRRRTARQQRGENGTPGGPGPEGGRPSPAGGRRALSQLVIVAAGVAAVAASLAGQLTVREAGPLHSLVADSAVVELTGRVRSEPVPVTGAFDESHRVVVSVERVVGRGTAGAAAAKVLVLGGASWQEVRYGEQVRFTGRLAATGAGRDVVGLAHALGPPETTAPANRLDRVVGMLRDGLLDSSEHLHPDARGLVPGLALGDTARIDARLDQAMRDVSLTHVTAVSGAHFAIVGATVLGLVTLLGVPRAARAVAVVVTTIGFVLLVHPEPSVMRAAVMGSIGVLALMLGRPSRAMPALATAVLGLVVVDPWLARSYGFVLSVLATAGLVLVARPVAARLETWLPRWLAHALAVPFAAQVACAPVLILLAPVLSTYAVPANLLAAPALVPGTVLGVVATLVGPWWPWLAVQLATMAGWACTWLAVVARTAAGLPGALIPWPGGPAGAFGLAVVLVGAGALLVNRHRLPRRLWLAVGALGVCLVLLLTPHGRRVGLAVWPDGWPPDGWRAVMCDVGQGTALVVRTGPGSAVVVDTGPRDSGVGTCLDRLAIHRVELLVLSHFHADHVAALPEVLAGRDVVTALVSPLPEPVPQAEAALEMLAAHGVPVVHGRTGMSGIAGEVTWRVLWPDVVPPGTGPNDASVVVWLAAPGASILALGDLETVAQDALARQLRAAGVRAPARYVVMAHHGSARQSRTLAELLDPQVLLVGVGADNSYGHPHPDGLALYPGAVVLRSDECGDIALTPTHHSPCS